MDNKFGQCCKCPARVDSMRQFTEYRNTNDVVSSDMKRLGFTSIDEYNDHIEKNGVKLIKENMKWQERNHKCQSNGQNTFNIDSSDYHKRFDEMIRSVVQEPIVPVDSGVMTGVLSTASRSNYCAKSINSDRPLFKMAKP
jgi:hypothetical protein